MLTTSVALSHELPGASKIWRAANAARGLPPTPARVERVKHKLADAAACLVMARDGERIVAMALAEPYRDQNGAGLAVAGAGHVSMVFVDPERWGEGIGCGLLDALHLEMLTRGWNTTSLWTRASNKRARRLYEGRGYRVIADAKHLPGGGEILRFKASLTTSA